MPSHRHKQLSVLTMNTIGFTACFAVWVMFSIIGIPIKTGLQLNDTEFGLLVAMPILTGSLLRLPLGMMTDKFGGRPVYFWLMAYRCFSSPRQPNTGSFWCWACLSVQQGLPSPSVSPTPPAGLPRKPRDLPWASSVRVMPAPL